MPRRVTPQEMQRLLRERQRQINEYNRKVDAHNREVKRKIDDHNRKAADHNRRVLQEARRVDAHNKRVVEQQKRAIDDYNRKVRAHNARVVAEARRAAAALDRLRSTPAVAYQSVRTSTYSLNDAYERLEARVGRQEEESNPNDALVLELPAQERANSLDVANALMGNGLEGNIVPEELQNSDLYDTLKAISQDLDARWRGALFALNPGNPDAARHFCTSAREIITTILDLRAPDGDVGQALPDCDRTKEGRPTRRSKILYILQRKGIVTQELGDFVDEDMSDVLGLFQVFNSATHGDAGKYPLAMLLAIKKRVEGGIRYLSRLVL